MLSTVLRILRSCPKLIQVNVRWAKEKCLNHLKQEGVYDVVEWEEDEKGMEGRRPKTLMVFERGIPLIGKPFSRRYKYTLPSSSGGVGRRILLLKGGGEGSRWRFARRKRVGTSGGDTDEGVVFATSPVDAVNESNESDTEVEADPEVEDDRDGEGEEGEEVNTSVKGKEVKRIGLPTTN